jgi:hypothetical protein
MIPNLQVQGSSGESVSSAGLGILKPGKGACADQPYHQKDSQYGKQ